MDLRPLVGPPDLIGGLAALFTIGLMRSRPIIIRANAGALRQNVPISSALIPWNGVVSFEHNEDAKPFCEVEGDVGYTVKWPVQASQSLEITPSADAALVGPEHFAEIDMARSGVPITTRARSKRVSRAGGEIR
jgi:hypothetical protein